MLERQVHYFVNGATASSTSASGTSPGFASRKAAAEKGFKLRHFGDILYARFHAEFGAIVDKVQVKIITDPELHAEWLEKAREAYDFRNQRLADLTDEAVDTFYDCTLCQSLCANARLPRQPAAIGAVRRLQLAGLQGSNEINPTGPNQPVRKGA